MQTSTTCALSRPLMMSSAIDPSVYINIGVIVITDIINSSTNNNIIKRAIRSIIYSILYDMFNACTQPASN